MIEELINQANIFLEPNEINRLRMFSKNLNIKSLENFVNFLNKWHYFRQREPCIYITDYGNIEIEWYDFYGKFYIIEFFDEYIEYLIEYHIQEEGKINNENINIFVERLG